MFTDRSEEKELMDLGSAYYSEEEYAECLKKLFKVNKFLGFFRDTITLLKKLPKNSSILDIGCGGGLFLLHLSKFFPDMKMLGLDICPAAISEAQKALATWKHNKRDIHVSFKLQEPKELSLSDNSIDVILMTLVCHHIKDDELVVFLEKIFKIANKLIIINDLQRNRFAAFLFMLVSPLLFQNRLITHDGLISIRRGFSRSELKLLLEHAGIHNYKIRWRFPFRWQIIIKK